MRICFVAILIVTVATSALGEVVRGPVTNPSNGHSYYLLAFGQTWTASEAEAQSLGGHLVTINDAAENNWLAETFGEFNSLYWIGLNDAASPNNFVWASGDPSTYRNWYPGQPGNGGGDYVALLTDQTRQWIPFSNGQGASGVVEVVPEPTGLLVVFPLLVLGPLRRRPRAAR